MRPPIPGVVADLTPELLTGLLQTRYPAAQVSHLAVVDCVQGAATRFRLAVDYGPEGDLELPRTFFAKTVMDSEVPLTEIERLVRLTAGPGMYANEVRFYREIRPDLAIETPRAFLAEFDEDTGRFLLLVEDLTPRRTRFPTTEAGLAVDEVERVLGTLARLHAAFWRSPRFATDLSWVETPDSGPFTDFLVSTGPTMLAHELGQEYKARLVEPLRHRLDGLAETVRAVQLMNAAGPRTLVHGDPHFANVYLTPDGAGGLVDWALLRQGCWAHDVAYFVGGALDVEHRREHEERLLGGYLATLARHGADPPDRAQAWRCYRANMVWGLLIWLLTPVPIHSEAAIRANVTRFLAAVRDLDSFDAVPSG